MDPVAESRASSGQNSGSRTAVEHIAAFAHAARPAQLMPKVRQLFKRNILDSLGSAIASLSAPPFAALREQLAEFRAPGRCTLIAGGRTSADQAAFFNTGLVRYVDLLDSYYIAPGGLCHPSDNFGAILAAAEQADASGEQFMLALAVAYEIQCRFTAAVSVMTKGFNDAIQLAMSAAAGSGKLLGLSVGQIANAVSIATVDNLSLACIHVEPVSQWKGFSPAMTGMRAIYAVSLAKRGFTGPRGLFEGPKGLQEVLGESIEVDWEEPSLESVTKTVLKNEGGIDTPLTWDGVVEKFHRLSDAFADQQLRARIIQTVQMLDERPISDLMSLLAQVNPQPVFPRTHAGIQ